MPRQKSWYEEAARIEIYQWHAILNAMRRAQDKAIIRLC